MSAARDALAALGWTPDRDAERAGLLERGYDVARVVRIDRGAYHVRPGNPDAPAKLIGGLRKAPRAERPAVGDWVALRPGTDTTPAAITAVLPRRSVFRRKVAGARSEAQVVAANVDVVFLVVGLDEDFTPRRVERLLLLAREGGVAPVVLLNKADLPSPDALAARLAETVEVAAGAPVHAVSSRTGLGLDAARGHLAPGRTVALLGSSGVGKSSLANRLLGEERLATRAVRASDGRGRHTTTHRELVELEDGTLLVDTPGMRELGVVGDEDGLDETFDDVAALAAACRYSDCAHGKEPGCAVLAALATGELDPARLAAFQKLEVELAEGARRRKEAGKALARSRRQAGDRRRAKEGLRGRGGDR